MGTRLNDRDSEVTNLCDTPSLAVHLHPPPHDPHYEKATEHVTFHVMIFLLPTHRA